MGINLKIIVKIKIMILGIALVIGVIALMIVLPVHSFLAISKPIKADVLVIEAWISNSALTEVAHNYARGYPYILIVGFPSSQRVKLSVSEVVLVRDYLRTLGIEDSKMHNLFVSPDGRKRTLSFATAVKQWLLKGGSPRFIGCNVVSEGVHARKSLLVYKRVLLGIVPVGVFAAQPSEYNPKYWFLSLIGWEWVVFDMVKYLRALIVGY